MPASVKNLAELKINEERSYSIASELGIQSCAVAVIDMPPNWTEYPAHTHSHDELEEIYVILKGSATLEVDGQKMAMTQGSFAKVDYLAHRDIVPGEDGASVLVIGAPVGKVYERPHR